MLEAFQAGKNETETQPGEARAEEALLRHVEGQPQPASVLVGSQQGLVPVSGARTGLGEAVEDVKRGHDALEKAQRDGLGASRAVGDSAEVGDGVGEGLGHGGPGEEGSMTWSQGRRRPRPPALDASALENVTERGSFLQYLSRSLTTGRLAAAKASTPVFSSSGTPSALGAWRGRRRQALDDVKRMRANERDVESESQNKAVLERTLALSYSFEGPFHGPFLLVPKASSRPTTRDSSTATDETWQGVEECLAAHEAEKDQLLHSLAVAKIAQDDAHDKELQDLCAELGKCKCVREGEFRLRARCHVCALRRSRRRREMSERGCVRAFVRACMRAFAHHQPLHGNAGTDAPRYHRSTATAPADKMHAKIGKLAHPGHHPSTRLRTSVGHGRSYDGSPPRRAADASCTEDGVGLEVSGLGEEVGGLVSQAEGLLEESANGTCAAAVVWSSAFR